MNQVFLQEKFDKLRQTTGANFWMRVAQLDDRSLALVATGHLDDFLAVAIVTKCRLMAEKKLFESVFAGEGPLSRFSSKINVARLLGLLVGETMHDITILRKIRNEFAHDSTFKDFTTGEISGRCKSLKLSVGLPDEVLNLAGTAERKAFVESAASISLHLGITVLHAISEMQILRKYQDELNGLTLEAVEKMKKGVVNKPTSGSVTASEPISTQA